MNQKRTNYVLRPKRKSISLGVGLLSMLICLGSQLALANSATTSKVKTNNPIQSTVTGTVVDSEGIPLPGANVLEKGTTNGTQTDFDGNYTLEVEDGATLVISYIGFMRQEVVVDGQSTINVTLAEDSAATSTR